MKVIKKLAVIAVWIAVWAILSLIIDQPLQIPSPAEVVKALFSLIVTADFWITVARTLLSVIAGFAFGVFVGSAFAFITAFSRTADTLISPVIKAVRAAPVVSFITLALLWFGKGLIPTIISGLMVMPVVWQAVYSSFKNADPLLLEMAHAYDFSSRKKLTLIYIPSSMMSFKAACLTSMGLAWKSGVAAEVLCQLKNTIGAYIHYSRIYLETSALFAWTFVVVVLSLSLEKLVSSLSGKAKVK